jgi:hypothetical protein
MEPSDSSEPHFVAPAPPRDGDVVMHKSSMSDLIPPVFSSRFSLGNVRGLFDLSTKDVVSHLRAAATPSNADFLSLLQKPDLYGALWVPASVSFATFALGNLTTWLRTSHDFEYNFGSLVAAFFWLNLFVFVSPFLFQYAGHHHVVVHLMALFGYSTVYIVPPGLFSVLVGKKLGVLPVLAGAGIGAYSVSRKTGSKEIQAFLGAPTRGQGKSPLVNSLGVTYFVFHLIVHHVCFL